MNVIVSVVEIVVGNMFMVLYQVEGFVLLECVCGVGKVVFVVDVFLFMWVIDMDLLVWFYWFLLFVGDDVQLQMIVVEGFQCVGDKLFCVVVWVVFLLYQSQFEFIYVSIFFVVVIMVLVGIKLR